MYVFAEPVSDEQIQDLQTKNAAKIREFERDILGLTAEEEESEWSDIQARVQEAMAIDEKLVENIGKAEEADGAATAAADDDEESDEEAEDEDDDAGRDSEGEKSDEEDVEPDEEGDGNNKEHLEDQIESTGISKSEDHEGTPLLATEHQRASPSAEGHGPNAHGASTKPKDSKDADSATDKHQASSHPLESRQNDQLAQRTTDLKEVRDVGPPSKSSASEDSSPDEDQEFLEDIARVQLTSVEQPQSEILAMTLTVRNKLNDSYILRPEKLQRSDAWSVEYSLNEVPNQVRSWSLYKACQMRRRKQLDNEAVEEDGESRSPGVDFFLRRLKEVTKESRKWRIAQDKIDAKQPIVVLGQSSAQKVGGVETQTST